jgi:transglutaminase-like putative cysteine protease
MGLRVPPLFLGAVLLFWGWQSGQPLVGALFALALESSRVASGRWNLSAKDFNRITDLSTLALVATLIYLVNEARSLGALRALLVWLPAFFMPLLLAQRFSVAARVPMTSLFLSLRGLQGRTGGPSYGDVDLQPPFFGLCLVCAGAGAAHPAWFLPGVAALFAWLLWPQRSARFHPALWLVLVLSAAGIGAAGNRGVQTLQHEMRHLFMEWYREHRRSFADPYRSYTGIGHIGELKLSDRIVFRVRAPASVSRPLLLRDAAYNTYSKGIWFAEDTEFAALQPGPGETSWILAPAPAGAPRRTLEISAELNRRGEGLIPHPQGTYRVDELPVLDFWRNDLGAVKVGDGPPLVSFRLHQVPGLSLASEPGSLDRLVPRELNDTLEALARQLDLAGRPPREIVRRIETFFARGFRYSLIQGQPAVETEPLRRFLLETRSGHCEYYATATVLLLRKAGVPARYATGFAVQEYSALEDAYLVRRRHAHSWALAWVDGGWRTVDTTPASWAEEEAEDAPLLQPLYDLYSWLRHAFMRWRWRPEDPAEQGGTPLYAWLLIPLAAVLVWRLLRGKRRSGRRRSPTAAPPSAPGRDSPFFEIVRRVEDAGWPRGRGEPLRFWLARATASPAFPWAADELFALLALHNRYRYGPAGDAARVRGPLEERVARWLKARDRAPDAPNAPRREGA